MPYSKNSDVVSNEEFLTQFITAYPEYAGNEAQIADDVATLRANPVVVAVRAFLVPMDMTQLQIYSIIL